MSSPNWKLKSKSDIVTRVGRNCHDCKKPLLTGSFARKFVFEKSEESHKLFKSAHICEDCERYYRGDNEPKM